MTTGRQPEGCAATAAVTPIKHRPDIDGLRSFAVVPVLLFHANLGLRGGFVGVDIFFVISGYLISSILFKNCADGTYSILGFYDRRIRRIFPALFSVLLATTIAALFILLPSELYSYGSALLYTVVFSSNMWFWSTTSYFGDPNIDIPLLHTWSLAIEEQFYIFWPFVVVLLAKISRRRSIAIIAIGLILSLLLSQWLTVKSPTSAFYMLPSRAWELLIGALLARLPPPSPRYARWLAAGGVLGLGMIVYSVVFFYDSMLFPGFWALIPCVGTALLLYTGTAGGPAARLLSQQPFVGIGLISYSLYLWHWPILSLAQLHLGRPLATAEAWAAIATSVLIAGLSWRYIERPFRSPIRPDRSSQRAFRIWAVGFGLMTMAGFAVVAGGLLLTRGLPSRLPPLARNFDRVANAWSHPKLPGCDLTGSTLPDHVEAECFRDATPTPTAVLWGDSHALRLNTALAERLRGSGIGLRSVTKTGCAPFAGATQLDQVGDPNPVCAEFNDRILAAILARPDITQVYISGRWGKFLGPGSGGATNGYLQLTANEPRDIATSKHAFVVSVETTIAKLRRNGKTVILFGPTPEFATSVSKCMARQAWSGRDYAVCAANLADRREIPEANAILRNVAASSGARYFDMLRPLCKGLKCPPNVGTTLYYHDQNHLTLQGARYALAHAS